VANHGEGSAARSVPHLRLCAGGTPLRGAALPRDFSRPSRCRAEKAKTFARGSAKIVSGADALLWGVVTPHGWPVPARTAPNSLTYGRGACGVYNRLSELKAMGPFRDGY
jgi:hypothetical protein